VKEDMDDSTTIAERNGEKTLYVNDDSWNKELEGLTARLLRHYRDKTTDMAPGTYTVDVARYIDEQRFALEVEHIFRRKPLLLALSAELPLAGDFKKLDIAGVPLLLVRGKDGAVKSLVNVCRHRGSPVCTDDRGTVRRFVCPYHGWSYNLDGSLAGVTAEQTFGSVERDKNSLIELPSVERDGVIWGGLTPGAALDLGAHLGELGPELVKMQLGALQHCQSRTAVAACNWKIAADGYQENYHLAFLHKKTLYRAEGMSNMMAQDVYGAHQRMGSPNKHMAELASEDDIAGKNQFGYFALNHIIFPNIVLLLDPVSVMVAQIFPGATVGESITHMEYFSRRPVVGEEEAKAFNARVDLIHDSIVNEDYWMGSAIQHGLSSGAISQLIFGRNEPFAHHFHAEIDKVLAAVGH
jgi:phenylpropionate dioxygenase-like ring-hydroxylating dioxygenase large terminal subunit